MHVVLRSLHVYPVKSLRGIDLSVARLTRRGLEHDRAWLLVDAGGLFMSQRGCPAMARIGTSITDRELVLSAKGQAPLAVPLSVPDGRRLPARVWEDDCEVLDEGDEVSSWFASALGLEDAPRLVRMAPDFDRELKRPDRYGENTTTYFADTAPLLVANVASLDALNRVLLEKGHDGVPMDRFRANLVVEGLEAFEEHQVSTLEGNGVRLGLRYPRERCVMTTMDQATGERDAAGEPFATLKRINPMSDAPRSGVGRGPAFGELAVIEAGHGGRLKTGAILEVA